MWTNEISLLFQQGDTKILHMCLTTQADVWEEKLVIDQKFYVSTEVLTERDGMGVSRLLD